MGEAEDAKLTRGRRSMTHRPRDGYLTTQIVLHWTVAALVILQVLAHEGMERAWDAFEDGEQVVYGPLVLLHIATGVTILVLALWRIGLRLRHGAPKLPASHPPVLSFIAHANHHLLYAFLIGMPLTGATAWLLGVENAADINAFGKNVLLALVFLHVGGALTEHFVLRSNVLRRMLGLYP